MRSLASLLAVAILPACGSPEAEPPAATGSVIVGVTSDLRAGIDLTRLHAVLSVDGARTRDEMLAGSTGPTALALPLELPVAGLADRALVAVQLEAFHGTESLPFITRLASTNAVAGESLLLRVAMDSRCAVIPGSSAPTCAPPLTCASGVCTSSYEAPASLPPYTPGWASAHGDVCKPLNAGPPVIYVGEGQGDYLPLSDGQTDQVETGPQGGHHVWVAIRQKNLHQTGSVTVVSGSVPELGVTIPPFSVIFTFDPDEGGFCKLYGLRFQLDGAMPIQPLLGKTLDLTVTVTDPDGTVGVGKKTVLLSKTFI